MRTCFDCVSCNRQHRAADSMRRTSTMLRERCIRAFTQGFHAGDFDTCPVDCVPRSKSRNHLQTCFDCVSCNTQHRATDSMRCTRTMQRGCGIRAFTQGFDAGDFDTCQVDCVSRSKSRTLLRTGALNMFLAIDSIVPLIPCGAQAPCIGGGVSGLSRKAFTQVMLTPAKWARTASGTVATNTRNQIRGETMTKS